MKTDFERLRDAISGLLNVLYHNGVPTDSRHPTRFACDLAELALADTAAPAIVQPVKSADLSISIADSEAQRLLIAMTDHIQKWSDSLDDDPTDEQCSGEALRFILSNLAAPTQQREDSNSKKVIELAAAMNAHNALVDAIAAAPADLIRCNSTGLESVQPVAPAEQAELSDDKGITFARDTWDAFARFIQADIKSGDCSANFINAWRELEAEGKL